MRPSTPSPAMSTSSSPVSRSTCDSRRDTAPATSPTRSPARCSPVTSSSRAASDASTCRESTDIVRKEMFTFTDAAGRSLTLRPEGTAPVCRAYVEHGMHKRRQPVKLWYLSSFYRHERAQAGRFRQFWQIGAEALGSEDPAVDAESILLLATLLGELQVQEVRLRLSSLGSLASRNEYRERLQAHLRANEARLSEDVRERIELNPLRAFDSDHPGTVAVMAGAPLLIDFLDAADREH